MPAKLVANKRGGNNANETVAKAPKKSRGNNANETVNNNEDKPVDYSKYLAYLKDKLIPDSNEIIETVETNNCQTLEDAKKTIILINENINKTTNKALRYSFDAGKCLISIEKLCLEHDEDIREIMKECNLKSYTENYRNTLKRTFRFSTQYPKICDLTLPIREFHKDFKKIKDAITSSDEAKSFWKTK